MQLFRKLLVRVGLDAKRLANGEYFEQERKIVQPAVTEQLWVLPEAFSESLPAALQEL